jgi:hypothetical protein
MGGRVVRNGVSPSLLWVVSLGIVCLLSVGFERS